MNIFKKIRNHIIWYYHYRMFSRYFFKMLKYSNDSDDKKFSEWYDKSFIHLKKCNSISLN